MTTDSVALLDYLSIASARSRETIITWSINSHLVDQFLTEPINFGATAISPVRCYLEFPFRSSRFWTRFRLALEHGDVTLTRTFVAASRMSVSDWGDWLVEEIESTTPETLTLWYLGCNGFVVKSADGTTIAIDPYVGLGDPPRTVRMIPVPFDPSDFSEMDAILATHEHTDHVHGPSQAPILASTGASFHAPDASLSVALEEEGWTDRWDVDRSQFESVDVGDTFDIGGLSVSVEAANDPDAMEPVSYVLEYDGTTIFHGGDSRPASEFESIGDRYDIDLGILAFGTVGMIPDKETGEPERTRWYSDENQVVEAALALQLDQLLPSHWDMWRGMTADPDALRHHASSFSYPNRVTVVEIGDQVSISP